MSTFHQRPTEGMPDMMPKGTVDNPPQKEPQNIPLKMVDQPYNDDNQPERKEPRVPEVPVDPDKKNPEKIDPEIGDPKIQEPKMKENKDEDFGVC
ncbi:hypothetical protein [Prevotella sp. 10(H)]|uniref:hypothetical protein n=1 Tax=Prevotella sp. 10(H) TaxID=1158294 RepID=UPI0004A717B5|nr:hypothetical protein [Prevotella sp. 10(H)]